MPKKPPRSGALERSLGLVRDTSNVQTKEDISAVCEIYMYIRNKISRHECPILEATWVILRIYLSGRKPAGQLKTDETSCI